MLEDLKRKQIKEEKQNYEDIKWVHDLQTDIVYHEHKPSNRHEGRKKTV